MAGGIRLGRGVALAGLLACSALIASPEPAQADPISVGVVLMSSAFAATTWTAGALAFSWTAFAVNAALGVGLMALSETSKPNMASRDRTMGIREAIGPRETIYGRRKTGGKLIFAESGPSESGEDDEHLHMVFALAGHQIDGIEEIYLNKKKVTLDANGFVKEKPWASRQAVRIQFKMGTTNQTAFESLVAQSQGKWTTAHRARGVALMYVRFRRSDTTFASGLPNVSVVLRGKPVLNLITNVIEWSENVIWCARDYLLSLGEVLSRINVASFRAAGAICAETVSTRKGSRKRYTSNAIIASDEKPRDVLRNFVNTMGGGLYWMGGQWHARAGAWTTPVVDLDESDLRSGVKVITRQSMRENFNGITGSFSGSETNWVPDSYPIIQPAEFVRVDNGQERLKTYDLPFTAYAEEAQRVARMALFRNREQLSISGKWGLRALMFGVGDTVRLTFSRFGWVSKTFECTQWKFVHSTDGDMAVECTFRETSLNAYSANPNEKLFERNNTPPPQGFLRHPRRLI